MTKPRLAAGLLTAVFVLFVSAAQSADTLDVHLVSQTSTTITLGWTPQAGYGYLFFQDCDTIDTGCALVSRTSDPNRSTVRFSKGHDIYKVAVITEGNRGTYQAAVPPSPPTATFTITPSSAVVGQNVTFDWTGTCPAGGCTAVWEDEGPDGPGGTDWPWGTGDPLVRSFESVGTKYVHLVVTDSAGASAESRQQLSVAATPPPAAQCADGIDNDGDTLIDYPADPGCTSATDNDETNITPPPPAQCADGLDNDADGKIDYPADPGCSSTTDNDETDAPPPGPSNVNVSPTGNDTTCTRGGTACRTLSRAYTIAQAGDVIELADGSYPGATLTGTKALTIQTAAGGVASFTGRVVLNGLQNVTIRGPFSTKPAYNHTQDVKDFSVDGCSRNLNLYDIRAGLFDVTGSADDISFFGGDFGGYTDTNQEDSWVGGDGSSCGDGGIVSNLLFDGIYLHDVLYVGSSQWGDSHPDCLQTGGLLDAMTIRNSRIMRCGNSFFGFYGDFGNFTNLLIENNLFYGIRDSYWGFNIDPKSRSCSITVRYNTYWPDNAVSGGYTYSPPSILCQTRQVYGNIFQAGEPGGCGSGSGWSYNVFEITSDGRDPCGTNATSGVVAFVNRPTDMHLAAGSLAIGKGDPARFPATDFEGTVRSSPPDAGYDER